MYTQHYINKFKKYFKSEQFDKADKTVTIMQPKITDNTIFPEYYYLYDQLVIDLFREMLLYDKKLILTMNHIQYLYNFKYKVSTFDVRIKEVVCYSLYKKYNIYSKTVLPQFISIYNIKPTLGMLKGLIMYNDMTLIHEHYKVIIAKALDHYSPFIQINNTDGWHIEKGICFSRTGQTKEYILLCVEYNRLKCFQLLYPSACGWYPEIICEILKYKRYDFMDWCIENEIHPITKSQFMDQAIYDMQSVDPLIYLLKEKYCSTDIVSLLLPYKSIPSKNLITALHQVNVIDSAYILNITGCKKYQYCESELFHDLNKLLIYNVIEVRIEYSYLGVFKPQQIISGIDYIKQFSIWKNKLSEQIDVHTNNIKELTKSIMKFI